MSLSIANDGDVDVEVKFLLIECESDWPIVNCFCIGPFDVDDDKTVVDDDDDVGRIFSGILVLCELRSLTTAWHLSRRPQGSLSMSCCPIHDM